MGGLGENNKIQGFCEYLCMMQSWIFNKDT